MIHGVYVRLTPQHKWRLGTICDSLEEARVEAVNLLEQARANRYEEAESMVKSFENDLGAPETLEGDTA